MKISEYIDMLQKFQLKFNDSEVGLTIYDGCLYVLSDKDYVYFNNKNYLQLMLTKV